MARKIYRDYKEKKLLSVDASKKSNYIFNSIIANEIKEKNAIRYNFSDEEFEKGIEWFDSGLSLDDAPDELRKSGSFIKGFQRGNTIKIVNETLYNTGVEFFEKGIDIIDVPDNYKNNVFFMDGYNDASNKVKSK